MAARRHRRRRNRTKIWRAPWWWAFGIHHFPEQLFFCPAAPSACLHRSTGGTAAAVAAAETRKIYALLGEHWKSLKPLIETWTLSGIFQTHHYTDTLTGSAEHMGTVEICPNLFLQKTSLESNGFFESTLQMKHFLLLCYDYDCFEITGPTKFIIVPPGMPSSRSISIVLCRSNYFYRMPSLNWKSCTCNTRFMSAGSIFTECMFYLYVWSEYLLLRTTFFFFF